jgi:thiol-disulfide isomerase/thioredoxin
MPKKLTLARMEEMAQERGGLCLSQVYVNTRTPLIWQCAKGHQWKAKPSSIQQGTWCPHCVPILTISEMQKIAQQRGGQCLSKVYVNSKTHLLWQCANGHQWKAIPNNIKRGSWCRQCRKGTITEMQQIAQKRGGQCVSEVYINTDTPILWQCAKGHQWKARPVDIKGGHWCPNCSSRKSEQICRAYFEALFEAEFPTVRPAWLTNDNNNYLELDGFNSQLKIAFEHQGRHHYEFDGFYHKTKAQFLDQQKNDDIKRQICQKHGILLIEIPELFKKTKPQDLPAFIKHAFNQVNYPIPNQFSEIEINQIGEIAKGLTIYE